MTNHKYEEYDETGASNILQRFGKYQIIQYFLVSIPTAIVAMNNVNYVFVAGDIEYSAIYWLISFLGILAASFDIDISVICRIPECESVDDKFLSSWWPDNAVDRCSRLNLNYTYLEGNQCDKNSFLSTDSECTQWIYGSNDTIVAWLDLACKPWKTNFVGTIHMIGWVLGMMVGGRAADNFGRKPTLIVASVGMIVGIIKTLIRSYYGYLFMELIESTISGSAFSAGMLILFEISSVDKRVLSGVVFAYAIYFGEVSLALVAMLVTYWKRILYISCAPSILFLIYIVVLYESPRWLVLKKKFDKARQNLKVISEVNKLNVNPEYIDKLDEAQLRQICNVEINTKKEGYMEAFMSKEMIKRLIAAVVGRFTVTFIYFGLISGSVWLPGNKYTNYFLTTVMSFPGDLLALYFLNRFGRRMSLFYGYLICGIASVASVYVPESYLWLKILFYLIGKLVVAACYTGIWTYTMELFPTSVRGSMFGLATLIASPGCMLAPLTPAMDSISPVFSSVLYGVSSITSAVLMLLSPETKGVPLAGTIEEVITVMKDKKKNKNIEGLKNKAIDENKNVTPL